MKCGYNAANPFRIMYSYQKNFYLSHKTLWDSNLQVFKQKLPQNPYGVYMSRRVLLSFRRLRCLKAIKGALKPHFVPDIEKGASLLDNFPSKT